MILNSSDKAVFFQSQEISIVSQVGWPSISDLRLSCVEARERADGVGGSDANVIFSGDPAGILRLWQEKRGECEAEDLSDRLSVALGRWTEAFNRQWFERLTGQDVVAAGEVVTSTRHPWRRCTLDGIVHQTGAVFEAKHTNSFVKAEDVLERYMPQLQHNMAVADVDRAVLSVIFGNSKYEMFEVAADWLYQLDLLHAEEAFWTAVQNGEPPVALPAPPPPRPIATRELSFEGNNAWASAAADWLEHERAAKTHASACKTLKELLDADVRRAFGHGIEASRSKAGAITIRRAR
jgi:predicted phage-related endonuclease